MTQELGRYLLYTRIATGGMAEIFLAERAGEQRRGQLVVVKRILAHLADSPELLAMFHTEAHVASQIAHPNVCRIHELGEERGQHFIVMEYLEGVTFARFGADLARGERPADDVRLAVSLVAQACAGLHHAHELTGDGGRPLGIVHRDVSPQNLMVTTAGVVKVLDFGIAKVHDAVVRTHSGVLKGKFQYMAPEQIAGRPVDRRTDVFALGAVLFELLAGQPLFARPNVLDVTRAIAEQPIPRLREARPDVPAALDEMLARALARDPAGRPPTARAMGAELAALAAPLGGLLAPHQIAARVDQLCASAIAARRALIEGAVASAEEERQFAAPEMPTERVAGAALPTTIDRRPFGRRRRGLVLVPLAIGAAAVALGAVWLARRTGGGEPESPSDASAAVARAPASPSDAAPASPPASIAIDAAPAPPPSPDRARPGRKKSARPGFFSIDSEPYATIYVDGRRLGDTPLFKIELAAGRHQVRAVCSCGKSRSFAVKIREGETHRARRLVW
jgi:hypothetical protein